MLPSSAASDEADCESTHAGAVAAEVEAVQVELESKDEPFYRRKAASRTRWIRLSCALASLAAVATVGFLWPRDPAWAVTRLNFDMDQLMSFITTALGGDDNTTATFFMQSVAELDNPNFIDAMVDDGRAPVLVEGNTVATFKRHAFRLPRRGSAFVHSNITVSLGAKLAKELYSKAMSNNGTLTVDAAGPTMLWAWAWFPLSCETQCRIKTDFMALFGDVTKIIEQKKCTYTYRLFSS